MVERYNMTPLEKLRCLFSNACIPKHFWTKAAYLMNKIPFSYINMMTFDELWFGKPSRYEHLRVFGCIPYVHIPRKLQLRRRKCIFMGYPEGANGYKLWRPETRKVVISCDVIFNELDTMTSLKHSNDVNSSKVTNTHQVEVEY